MKRKLPLHWHSEDETKHTAHTGSKLYVVRYLSNGYWLYLPGNLPATRYDTLQEAQTAAEENWQTS